MRAWTSPIRVSRPIRAVRATAMDDSFTRTEAGLHWDLAAALHACGEQDEAKRHLKRARELAQVTGPARQRRRIRDLARRTAKAAQLPGHQQPHQRDLCGFPEADFAEGEHRYARSSRASRASRIEAADGTGAGGSSMLRWTSMSIRALVMLPSCHVR